MKLKQFYMKHRNMEAEEVYLTPEEKDRISLEWQQYRAAQPGKAPKSGIMITIHDVRTFPLGRYLDFTTLESITPGPLGQE